MSQSIVEKIAAISQPEEIIKAFDQLKYVADEGLATALFLSLKLQKPLMVEGHPGVGKTEVALMLSEWLNTDLIRLQCYEGLDVHAAVYEWNYQKQLLNIKLQEQSDQSAAEKEAAIFGEDYLLRRPLLQAISADKPPILLIDEIDRTDEEFEAFLLELLSAWQISVPEMGTIKAKHIPIVILTSNRTRELSDALKRRCLYHWVPYPDQEKELAIVHKKLPNIEESLVKEVVNVVQELRKHKLNKVPGIAETLDWASGLLALGYKSLSREAIDRTMGCLLKSTDDFAVLQSEEVLSTVEA